MPRVRLSPRLLAAFLTVVALGWFQEHPAEAARSVHPALTRPIDPSLLIHQRFLSRGAAGEAMVDLFVEGDVPPGLLRASGIEVQTVAGRLVTARCPLGRLSALLSMSGIERIEIAERCEPYLEQSAVEIGLPSVRTVPPPDFAGATGAGVLVGIVDSGVDLEHPDFQNPDGTTRLVSLWDQNTTGTPPAGFIYGTEWSKAQIDAGLATHLDGSGHGTHVLGIAGGDGSGTGNGVPEFTYVGVAPKADLCVVATTFGTTSIADGVSYIFQKAAALGKKAVVNLSLGSQQGPHDGTGAFDVAINALTGPGKIVVASAGNKQQDGIHAQLTVAGSPQAMTLDVPSYFPNGGPGDDYILFTGWYGGGDQLSLTITSPGGTVIGPIPTGSSSSNNNTMDGYVNANNATTAPSNGDHEIYIEIYDQTAGKPPGSGTWTFTFTPVSITSTGVVDMWAYTSRLGSAGALPRWVQGLAVGGVIGTPGSADSVIAVGAHTTKDCWASIDGLSYCWNPRPTLGSIASFSSWGPLRDGRIKPDLSGPGFGVASSLSTATAPAPPDALVVPDGLHVVEAGTSMSSPHVAGTAALLLAQPFWSGAGPATIRARLQATARADSFTGVVPNVAWGSGKLDAAAALTGPTAVEAVATAAAPRFHLAPNAPNPFNPSTVIAFGTERRERVALRIFNARGELVRTLVDAVLSAGSYRARWDGRSDRGNALASGVYVYQLTAGGKRLSRKMSLLK